ncbi:hypothetical protein D081_0964 [Anaerovibrio sp. JC8]|nr:hypothetical protein D081_0964 [Anaerovibrio sp. JC8]
MIVQQAVLLTPVHHHNFAFPDIPVALIKYDSLIQWRDRTGFKPVSHVRPAQ